MLSDPMGLLLTLPAILFALTIHEYAHGVTALRFGDRTALNAGRLTLNPLVHLDPMGTLLLIIAHFGWAKPVPVDPRFLKNPKTDMIWISAAGPGANIATALVSGLLLRMLPGADPGSAAATWIHPVRLLLNYSLLINLILAVFNFIPIFPLDGAKVLEGLLPLNQAYAFSRLERYGPILLLALVFSGRVLPIDPLGLLLGPVVGTLGSLFGGRAFQWF
jgi:Zn-dependent protease